MKPLIVNESAALAALRALATVATSDQSLDARERRFLELHAALASAEIEPESLEPIDPAECAELIRSGTARHALLQRMVLMTLLDEVVQEAELTAVRAFAKAFAIDEPSIGQMEMFAKGRIMLLAFDLGRRGFIGKEVKRVWEERGLRGVMGVARAMAGGEDDATAARYRALGELPEGTLGRAYFDHCRDNAYPLPGEKGGAPEMLRFHDMGHVLTGYTTDPAGEIRMGSFEAGYMGTDGFSVILLAMYVFHLGAPLPNTQPSRGEFDVDAFAEAYARGQRLLADLRSWDPTPHLARPLEDVRFELGIEA